MQNIKKVTKFIFVFKPLNHFQAHATFSQVLQYHALNLVRRLAILLILSGLIASGFYIGRYFYPHVILKDNIVKVEVEKIQTFPPMLKKICTAESGWKQFKSNGDVVRGRVTPSDVGICQINESINNDEARRLGYDIFTEQGNKDFALYLFNTQGTAPWNASKATWSK